MRVLSMKPQGVYSIEEALHMAQDLGMDLIEISPNAKPPVCRIADYQKFLLNKRNVRAKVFSAGV
ncbi:hypothetical protein MASR1M31_03780 [Porphyromonadaceae bacterium]